LSVSDTGRGMNAKTRARAFEPFFTTKPPGEGTGLGLAVVHGIIRDHDGTVIVDSKPGKGTRVDLYFPAHGTTTPATAAAVAQAPHGNGERILFVDDEPPLCRLAQQILGRLGYVVETFDQPNAAVRHFEAHGDTYDLVITDLSMPGLSGTELARQVLSIEPTMPVILLTGYSGTWNAETVSDLGIRKLLLKPIDIRELALAVERALGHAPPVEAG